MLETAATPTSWFSSLISISTPIVAAAALISTGAQYFFSYATKAKDPFLSEQLKLYLEICQVVSVIADSEQPDSDERVRAKRRFREMYFGQLALVETPEVESAMVTFDSNIDKASKEDLQQLALAVSHACRDSVSANWRLSLKVLTGKTKHKHHIPKAG